MFLYSHSVIISMTSNGAGSLSFLIILSISSRSATSLNIFWFSYRQSASSIFIDPKLFSSPVVARAIHLQKQFPSPFITLILVFYFFIHIDIITLFQNFSSYFLLYISPSEFLSTYFPPLVGSLIIFFITLLFIGGYLKNSYKFPYLLVFFLTYLSYDYTYLFPVLCFSL